MKVYWTNNAVDHLVNIYEKNIFEFTHLCYTDGG